MQGNQEKEGKISSNTKIFKKIKSVLSQDHTTKTIRSVARGSLSFFAAFFFSQCPLLFSSYPLGIAFLCAAKYDVIYALAGAVLGALSLDKFRAVYICACAVAVILRALINFITDSPKPDMQNKLLDKSAMDFSDKLTKYASRLGVKKFFFVKKSAKESASLFERARVTFRDTYAFRSLLAFACSAFAGICTFILGGFAFYDVFGLIFATVFAAVAAFLFSFLYEQDTLRIASARELANIFFVFFLVLACKNSYALGISVGLFVAFFVLLSACKRRSFMLALTYAFILGCALSLKAALFFALSALSLLSLKDVFGRSTVFLAASVIVLGTVFGAVHINPIGAVGAMFLSIMIYLLLDGELGENTPRTTLSQRLAQRKQQNRDAAAKSNASVGNMVVSQSKMESTEQKLKSLSESFESLSEMFFSLSDKLRRPAILDLRKICDSAFEPRCRTCPQRDVCLGLEYGTTLEVINRLASKLHTRGYVEADDFPQYLRIRCKEVKRITDAINSECARVTETALRTERNEILALDYSAISRILNDALESERESYTSDESIGAKIYDFLYERGHAVKSAVFLSGRRKQIILSGINSDEISRDIVEIKKELSNICATEFRDPTFEVRSSLEYAYFIARRKIRTEHATLRTSAEHEGVCGDSTRIFTAQNDLCFSLISDGMGSGASAALSSGICAVFLEKMLTAGNKSNTSVRVLNDILRSRTASSALECSCTVDLAQIDLINSSASFTKCGAAPSYVIRNSKIYKIEADTAPIGILEEPNVHVTRFALRSGDIIVMISDGAIVGDDDSAFIDFLGRSTASKISSQRLCELIMANAKICDSTDDVSCTVIKVYKN